MAKERRKMIIHDLTINDYRAILESMEKLGIQTYVQVLDQNGYGVYTKSVTKAKHIPDLKLKGESR